MSCEECLELLDDFEHSQTPELRRRATEHFEHCGACQQAHARLEDVIARLRAAPRPLPGPALIARLNARIDADLEARAAFTNGHSPLAGLALGLDEERRSFAGLPAHSASRSEGASSAADRLAPAAPPIPPDARAAAGASLAFKPRGSKRQASRISTLAGSLRQPAARRQLGPALLVVVGALSILLARDIGWMTRAPADRAATGSDQTDPVRMKNAANALQPLALDLQVSVERLEQSGQYQLERAEDGTILSPGDGLIFRFSVEGGNQLLLLERDPEHHIKVLLDRDDIAALPPQSQIEITSPQGKPLRYQADGPPGTYTLLAVLSRTAKPVTSARLDAYWDLYVDQLLEHVAADADPDLRLEGMRFERSAAAEPTRERGLSEPPGGASP